jgi:hypothetical protein
MSGRTKEDYEHERQALDAAHAQNEAGRDAFIAVAHTALFAASISFVADVAPITKAIWIPILISAWAANVIGLFALTLSFGAARRAIDARRAALNDEDPPNHPWAEGLNAIALWSFPASLLCLFSFVTANVIHANDRPIPKKAVSVQHRDGRSLAAGKIAVLRDTRGHAAAASANAHERSKTVDGRSSSPACACAPAAASTASAPSQKIGAASGN